MTEAEAREIRALAFEEAAELVRQSAIARSEFLRKTRPDQYPWWPEEVQRTARIANDLRVRAAEIRKPHGEHHKLIPIGYNAEIGCYVREFE